jgi:exopolysaccharide biosynthesis polyprenyl glycosylphosphotransferase
MKRDTPDKYVLALLFSDLLATVSSLALALWLRQTLPYGLPFSPIGGGPNLAIYSMALLIWTVTFAQLRAYDPDRLLRIIDEMNVVLRAVATSTLLLAGALYLTFRGLSRLLFVYFAFLDAILVIALRLAIRFALKRQAREHPAEQRILLVGAGELGDRMAKVISEREWMGLQVVGFLDDDPQKAGVSVAGFPVLGTLDAALTVVEEHCIHEVIVTLPSYAYKRLEQLISILFDTRVNVRVVPDVFPLAYLRPTVGALADTPLITLKEPALNAPTLLAKRLLDLLVAVVSLLLLWPVMLLVAVWIRLDSPGPAIFRQERVGLHGRPFTLFKFRTMITGAERQMDIIIDHTASGQPFLRKDRTDPRVTRAGRFLRRWSLDELPQLFNVLKGEMSLVGPRPDLPSLMQDYESWQHKRYSVPPGITGWWQITGRSTKPSTLHVEDDLYYIRNHSLLLDLQILARTVGAVVRGEGAY